MHFPKHVVGFAFIIVINADGSDIKREITNNTSYVA
jgi:hypothetical protein